MNDNFTGYNTNMRPVARQLRRNMTPQEKHLWYDFLRSYPVKVYRQRSIDRFVVDFYCSRAHLVIELDGGQHYTPEGQAYDQERSDVLAQYELEIIRFSNADINSNFEGVCMKIEQAIQAGLEKWG